MDRRLARVRDRTLAYRVRISPRARAWSLTIHPDAGLTVVLPPRARVDPADLLRAKADWILRHLDRLARRPTRTVLEHGSAVPYLGDALRIEVAAWDGAEPAVEAADGVLRVRAAPQRPLRAVVEAWYRARAAAVIAERLEAINASLGYRYARVTIRDQKTRWGSCSARGNLAFNWRLVMAPIAIIDYVVAHELVHLVVLSHAPAFWTRVAAIDPAHQEHRRWLRDQGPRLVLGG
ncbi:MAG: SprT family zinc-dependent metalloprotease [Nitrospiria bacterium]